MKLTNKIKTAVIIILILGVCVAGYLFIIKPKVEFTAQNATETIRRPEIGLEFSYVAGPHALSMFEPSAIPDPISGAFILMPSTDYVAVHNQENSGTPASITFFVIKKDNAATSSTDVATDTPELSRIDKIKTWAMENDGLTGISAAEGEVTEIHLDGIPGIQYANTGSFKQDVYILSYRDSMYLFVGQYENDNDEMRQYFKDVLDTVRFD